MAKQPWMDEARKAGLDPRPIWFYRPGKWNGLIAGIGHDEFARRTVWFGSWLTGAVVIAVRNCRDPECEADRDRMIRDERADTTSP